MTEHVPGPWVSAAAGVMAEDGPTHFIIRTPSHRQIAMTPDYTETDSKNAFLIAAAPALLAAAEAALPWIDELMSDADAESQVEMATAAYDLGTQLRAAIAQARGDA